MIECKFDFSDGGTNERSGGIPEETVVADEEFRLGVDRGLKGGGASVHAGSNFFNGAIIFDL